MKLEDIEKLIAEATPGLLCNTGSIINNVTMMGKEQNLKNSRYMRASYELMPKLLRVVKEAKTLIPDSYAASPFFEALAELEK